MSATGRPPTKTFIFEKCLGGAILHKSFILGAACVALLAGCDRFGTAPEGTPDPSVTPVETAAAPAPTAAEIAADLAAGNFDLAARNAQAAVDAKPGDAQFLLLLARAQARLQNVGSAVAALQASFDAGFYDPRGALDNPDFDDIRSNKIFADFAKLYQSRSAERPLARLTSPQPERRAVRQKAPATTRTSTIRAGDVSITETSNGHGRIRAGDVIIED